MFSHAPKATAMRDLCWLKKTGLCMFYAQVPHATLIRRCALLGAHLYPRWMLGGTVSVLAMPSLGVLLRQNRCPRSTPLD